jgi:CRP-like cAMP-binding protein
MKSLMCDSPRLVANLLAVLLDRTDEFQVRLRDLMTVPIEKRLARAVLHLADEFGVKRGGSMVIDSGFTLKDLAELTGTTLFTASRVTSNWERAHIVTKERGALTLKNQSHLNSIAK